MAANREPEGKRETTQSKLLLLLNAKHAYRSSSRSSPLCLSRNYAGLIRALLIGNRVRKRFIRQRSMFDAYYAIYVMAAPHTTQPSPPFPFPRWAPFVFALCARAQRHIRYKDLELLLSCQRRRYEVYKTVTVKVTVTVTWTVTKTVTETKTVTRKGAL